MSKLRDDFRVAMLGAAGGLFSISLFLLVARVDAYYRYLWWLEENNYESYERGVEGLWWIPISFWHLLLSIVSSIVIHRYLPNLRLSPFLLWQTIGFSTLLSWGLTFIVLIAGACLMDGDTSSLDRLMDSTDMVYATKYVAAIFGSNVLFGSAIKASSRLYAEAQLTLVQEGEASISLVKTAQ
jgi:hypothetical protein